MKDIHIAASEIHSSEKIIKSIIRTSTNILLKNYCKTKNDAVVRKQNKRKLNTLSKN